MREEFIDFFSLKKKKKEEKKITNFSLLLKIEN